MSDGRYIRWQGLMMAQFSVALALISGLSLSALILGMSLIQNDKFKPLGCFRPLFDYSLPLIFLAIISSTLAVISRTLDFRLTARKVRKDENSNYDKPLTILKIKSDTYGRITWGLFWSACVLFFLGVFMLFWSIWSTYR